MLTLIGILLGLIIGLVLQVDIPSTLSTYIGVIILASFDSMIGALHASMLNRFNPRLFASGLIGNALIAVVLTALGRALDIQLSMAAIFAFGVRIFNNFSGIRRLWLERADRRQHYTEIWLDDGHAARSDMASVDTAELNRESHAQKLEAEAERLRQRADALVQEADTLWVEEARALRQHVRRPASPRQNKGTESVTSGQGPRRLRHKKKD